MKKVLFVCLGNICRSPMAEAVMADLVEKCGLQQSILVASAATSSSESGNPIHRGTKAELQRRGVPYSESKRAHQMTLADAEWYDYIVVMDESNREQVLRMFKDVVSCKTFKLLECAGSASDIADPWYTGNFEKTFLDCLKGCTALLNKLKKEL